MRLFRAICLFAVLISGARAFADLSEETASANALSGITFLSDNVGDRHLSPIITTSGIDFSYHYPFGDGDAGVIGFHNAFRTGLFNTAVGISVLNHPDYRWQDHYLSVNIGSQELALGYTQHLLFERIGEDDSYYTWTGDVALGFQGDPYGTEIRYIRMGTSDAQLHLTASTIFAYDITVATDYVYSKRYPDSFRCATSYDIAGVLQIMTSWQDEPPRFGFGVGLRFAGGNITYAMRSHPRLNLSHSFDIGFTW
jgi:hypothetical protein